MGIFIGAQSSQTKFRVKDELHVNTARLLTSLSAGGGGRRGGGIKRYDRDSGAIH